MNNIQLIKIILSLISCLFGSIILKKMIFAWNKLRFSNKKYNYINTDDLPTVSVCIPIRNEGRVLEDSLNQILDSDYPKMEVIVLDDQSVDKTTEIIKNLAHRGIRFIKGSKLPDGWIGKNKALDELSNQAVGEYILFLGIDTKISKSTITDLIYYMINEDVEMISIMPRNNKLNLATIFGTMRFFWEIVLHSETLPAISTSAWLVKTESLEEYQDFFEKHKSTVRPEESLARYFYENNSYRFLMASNNLKINYDKEWSSQAKTSIRTMVPLLEKAIHLKGLVFCFLLIIVCSWFIIVYSLITKGLDSFDLILLCSLLVINLDYLIYNVLTKPKNVVFGFLFTPLIFLQEIVLLIIGYVKYKNSTISWKGRKLPEVDD